MPNSTPSQTHQISIADLLESFSAQHQTMNPQTTAGEPTNNNSSTLGSETFSPSMSNLPFTTLIETFPSLLEYVVEVHHVGSTYICNPPPLDTDVDNLVLLDDKLYKKKRQIFELLEEEGWDGNEEYFQVSSEFHSFKKDNLNLIFTFDHKYFTMFVLAAQLCKSLNVLSKTKRIAVHNTIINGISPTPYADGLIYDKSNF